MSTRVEDRVSRGASLLDAVHPGWASRIDVQSLDITSMFNCVLGQVFGGYNHGIREVEFYQEHFQQADRIDLMGILPCEWGFSLEDWSAYENENDMQELDDLHDAWNVEVNARLNKA